MNDEYEDEHETLPHNESDESSMESKIMNHDLNKDGLFNKSEALNAISEINIGQNHMW